MNTLTLVLLLLSAVDEWTRFRGPNGSGISSATNLPIEFGPERNVIWKTPLPPGHSSPILTEKYIFVTGYAGSTIAQNNYRLVVLAIERANGRIAWEREVPRTNKGRIENVNNPASPSVVTDGESVFA